METLYLGIMLGMKLVQSLFVKRVSAGLSRPEDDLQYGFWSKMAAAAFALMILCLTGFTEPDLLTLLTAALMGLSLAAGTLCSLEAMRSGTVILCTMAGSAGLLLPIFAGALWWGESVSVWQWMGIAVLLVSGWLLVGSSRKIYTNFSGKTLLLLAGSLLFNGLTMVAQKLFSLYAEGGECRILQLLGISDFRLGAGGGLLPAEGETPRGRALYYSPAREHLPLLRDSGSGGADYQPAFHRCGKDRTLRGPVYRGEWRRHRSCRVDGGGVF